MQPAQQQKFTSSRTASGINISAYIEFLACSPYCWAIRFALVHKGLKYETVPWHFQEQDKIKMSNQGLV